MSIVINKNKYLSKLELEHLEAVLERNYKTDTRNVLMLWLALRTGARAQEILNVTKRDLDPHDHTVFIKGLKDSNDREIPLRAEFFKKLYDYAQTVEGDKIFPIGYQSFWEMWQKYKPADKGLHALRHTFAIELCRKKKDIRVVKLALGHKNIANTMVYADYLFTTSELRKAML